MSTRLTPASLDQLPGAVARPAYDRTRLPVGIVHLGLGAFHRAHQAVYTEDALAGAFGPFGICGVSLRHAAARDRLAAQEGLYTVAEKSAAGLRLRMIGCLKEILVGPEDPAAVAERIADPAVAIVSLTVTEKGYCHDPATGALAAGHPDIRHDLAHPERPRSALGTLIAGLDRRRLRGLAPPTVLCGDNLPSNGRTLKGVALAFAALRDDALARWIEAEVAFPCTMVDRIVPATTDRDVRSIAARLGLHDAAPVLCEPFRQWVIEDRFVASRPAWERVGAEFVADTAPYEEMKLRLLNGSHSALAYLGGLAGFEHIADVMRDAAFRDFMRRMMAEEVAPTLAAPADLAAYQASLLERFANPRSATARRRSRATARRSCRSGCSARSGISYAPAARSATSRSRSPPGCAMPPAGTSRAGRSRSPIRSPGAFGRSPLAPAPTPPRSPPVFSHSPRYSATICRARSASPPPSPAGSVP
jgi:fructuronate reductase